MVVILCLTTYYVVQCRPEEATTDRINVEDTDDEFIIKKPASNGPTYDKFLDELYRHDESKTPIARRSAEEGNGHEKLPLETPEEFNIPKKPEEHHDENYDQFLSHLYRHDELKRSRRMIVFRHDILENSPQSN